MHREKIQTILIGTPFLNLRLVNQITDHHGYRRPELEDPKSLPAKPNPIPPIKHWTPIFVFNFIGDDEKNGTQNCEPKKGSDDIKETLQLVTWFLWSIWFLWFVGFVGFDWSQ